MPAHPTDPARLEIFDRAVARMGRRLQRVRSAGRMMSALRWGMDELDRTFAGTPAAIRATVACHQGCDACCHVPVDTQAHEIFLAADHIQVHFGPDELDALIGRLAVNRGRMAACSPGKRELSRQPCALLREGACSIYDARPQPCRSHHASDAGICAAHLVDPSVDISRVYIPALRARMFAVMLGIDEALESAGYDDRAYDFGSALHEALTNRLCLVAWMRRKPAFPDSCLADPCG